MEMFVLIVAAPQKNGTVPNYSKQSEIREQLQLALMPVLAALIKYNFDKSLGESMLSSPS